MKTSVSVVAILLCACTAKVQTDTSTAQPQAQAVAEEEAPAPVDPIPEMMGQLTPQIAVDDVAATMAFYARAFGATEVMKLAGPDGSVIHGEVKIGDSVIMIDMSNPGVQSPKTVGGTPLSLFMYVADADEAVKTAVAAGATELVPLADMFWGDRYGELLDPAGHRWSIAQNIEVLTPEQMQQRAEIVAAEMAAEATKKKGKRKIKRPTEPKWKSVAGTPATNPIPEGYETVTMSLTVPDAAAAIEFYTKVLGATERGRMPTPDGKLMHAELAFGKSVLMLSDEMYPSHPSAKTLGGSPFMFHHYTTDVDAAFAKATEAGAKSVLAITDMFWGDRYGAVVGPDGIAWGIATRIEDVSPEEMEKRMKEQAPPADAAPKADAPAADAAATTEAAPASAP